MLETGNSFFCDGETVWLFHNTRNLKQNSGNSYINNKLHFILIVDKVRTYDDNPSKRAV